MRTIEVWKDRHGSWTAQCGRYREELDLEPEAQWHELIEAAREAFPDEVDIEVVRGHDEITIYEMGNREVLLTGIGGLEQEDWEIVGDSRSDRADQLVRAYGRVIADRLDSGTHPLFPRVFTVPTYQNVHWRNGLDPKHVFGALICYNDLSEERWQALHDITSEAAEAMRAELEEMHQEDAVDRAKWQAEEEAIDNA